MTKRSHHLCATSFDEVQTFQGKLCWKESPKLADFPTPIWPGAGMRNVVEDRRGVDGSKLP